MVAFILPANSATGGYEIDNSMRFNRGDAACLRKTFSGSPTSTKKCTISFWTKLADPSNTDAKAIFSAIKSGSNEDVIKFMGVNNGILNGIEINFNNTGDGSMMISSGSSTLIKFRDPSAWYHIVIAIDSSQGTASNRVKVYVNGTQFDTEARVEGGSVADDVALSQNYELGFLTASAHSIGENVESAGNEPYDGYLAEFHFVDGQQLAPTTFAETDDNGAWIPKDCKGDLTYGNYGFFLEFKQTGTSANASGKGADTSGNDNHFDDANATAEDITVDTPTNNFATLNPLIPVQQVPVYSEGNTKVVFKDGGNGCSPLSTFAVNSGKFYFEAKFVQTSDPGHGAIGVGIVDADKYNPFGDADDAFDLESFGYSYTTDGNAKTSGNDSSFGDEFNSGDIIGVAVDFDNRQIYYSKNGTFQDSGDPTSGASGTGSAHNFSVGTYYFAVYAYQEENSWEMNFGNAPFSISSGNADANGYGNFEYAVPSGYYSLCTKNLAEYG